MFVAVDVHRHLDQAVKTSALIRKLRKYLPKGLQSRLAEELKGKLSRSYIQNCCTDVRQNDLVDETIIAMAAKGKAELKKKERRVKALAS